jgi:ligand-binding sensor domain-containing protein/signal transduction histidine kinase
VSGFRHWAAGLVLLLAFCAYSGTAHAQPADTSLTSATFTHLSVRQGLSDQQTWYVLQDHTGFTWVATRNGLDRYDGYTVTSYRYDQANPNSLGGNDVEHLYEDDTGTLWVSTWGAGVDAFDEKTERFTHFRNDPANPRSLSNDAVAAMAEDRSGTLWFGTYGGGLDKLDRVTGTFTTYRNNTQDSTSLSDDSVTALFVDRTGRLWVGTGDGLDRFDPNTNSFSVYRHDSANSASLSQGPVADIVEDHAGVLWIATQGGGLNSLDPGTGRFSHYVHDASNSNTLGNDRINCIAEDAGGTLWLATWGGGLSALDSPRETFTNFRHDPRDPDSLSSDFLTCVRSSRSGLLWVTGQSGLDLYNPLQQAFSVYGGNSRAAGGLASDNVSALYDAGGITWVGTRDRGLDRLDRSSGQVVHYEPDARPGALGFPWISSIDGDGGAGLWIGTYGGGLYQMDSATGTFITYRHRPGEPASLGDDLVNAVKVDRSGAVWIAVDSAGVDCFRPASGSFDHYRHDPNQDNSLSSDNVLAVDVDQNGDVWIGTWGAGLNQLDPTTGNITRYEHNATDPNSLSSDYISDVHVDKAGVLWVATPDGLDRFDVGTSRFTHYSDLVGLPSNDVNSILEDGDPASAVAGNIWVVTAAGLSKLDRNDGSLRTYGGGDGVPQIDFAGAHAVSREGELLIGGTGGLVAFDPAAVRYDAVEPPIVLTNFLLANRPVAIDADGPLHQAIDQTQQLQLTYSDRVVSFEFAALSYVAPQQNRYRYKLDGFDRDWIEVDGTHRVVTFTNLDPGTYVFRVTGANSDGVWNETERTLEITIAPAWWGTWWFRVLAIACVCAAAAGAYLVRVRALNADRQRLARVVADRTRALELAVADRQSALETRDLFVRTLAHDLKAPLTSLAWYVQLMRRHVREGTLDAADLDKDLQAVAANTDQAVSAIDELHDLSAFAAGTIVLHREPVELVELARQVMTARTLAPGHHLQLVNSTAELWLEADQARLRRVLGNLLDNAVKYSPDGGEITVRIDAQEIEMRSWAVIRVEDHGIGIPPGDLPHLFERFQRGSKHARHSGRGHRPVERARARAAAWRYCLGAK